MISDYCMKVTMGCISCMYQRECMQSNGGFEHIKGYVQDAYLFMYNKNNKCFSKHSIKCFVSGDVSPVFCMNEANLYFRDVENLKELYFTWKDLNNIKECGHYLYSVFLYPSYTKEFITSVFNDTMDVPEDTFVSQDSEERDHIVEIIQNIEMKMMLK